MKDSFKHARRFGHERRRRACGMCFLLLLAACGVAAAQEGTRAGTSQARPCFVPRFEVETNPSLAGIYFSPDGRYVTQRGRKRVKVWDVSAGTVREYTGNRSRTTSLAFSADGSRLAAGDTSSDAWVWDVTTGRLLARLQTKHQGEVEQLAISPDGRLLATIGEGGALFSLKGNTKVKLWDVDAGRARAELTLPDLDDVIFSALAFGPDGRTLAAVLGRKAGLWDVQTAKLKAALVGPKPDDVTYGSHGYSAIRDIMFSPDGSLLATLSFYGGEADLWDAESGRLVASVAKGARAMSFSRDGRLLAVGDFRKTTRVLEVRGGKLLRSFEGERDGIVSVSFSPDGRLLACSDGRDTNVWNVETGQLEQKLKRATMATFSPDGRALATFYGGRLTVRDASCR